MKKFIFGANILNMLQKLGKKKLTIKIDLSRTTEHLKFRINSFYIGYSSTNRSKFVSLVSIVENTVNWQIIKIKIKLITFLLNYIFFHVLRTSEIHILLIKLSEIIKTFFLVFNWIFPI